MDAQYTSQAAIRRRFDAARPREELTASKFDRQHNETYMPLPTEIQDALNDMQTFVESYNWDMVSERRIDILKTFLRQAAAQGYSALTMRGLAKELNLKAPSIYSHFPDGKEEIIAHSLRWQASLFGRAILNGTRDTQTPEEFLELLVKCHCRMNIENRENNLWDIIVASDRIGKFLPMELRAEMHNWIAICTELYASAARSLGYEGYNLKARQVMAAIDGVHNWVVWNGSEADMNRILGEATSLCKTILAAPAPEAVMATQELSA